MHKVAVVKGTNPVETTVKALEMIRSDIDSVLSERRPILIKPNYINSKHPSTGITTDSRVIEGIVKFLREHKIKEEIIIGEGSEFADTFYAFKVAGVDAVAEGWGVRLVDLNKDEFVEVNPPNPLSLKKVRVAKTALASKGSMHMGRLSRNIADLAPFWRRPVEMNLIITGTDPVAFDTIGAAVMGIPPTDVKHLLLAEKKELGTCNLEEITVLGEPIEKVKRKFRRSLSSKLFVHLG